MCKFRFVWTLLLYSFGVEGSCLACSQLLVSLTCSPLQDANDKIMSIFNDLMGIAVYVLNVIKKSIYIFDKLNFFVFGRAKFILERIYWFLTNSISMILS